MYSFTDGIQENVGKHWDDLKEADRKAALNCFERAQRWMEQSKWANALGMLNQAVLIYPYFAKAIEDMATCYTSQGQSDKAIKCWEASGRVKRESWQQPGEPRPSKRAWWQFCR